MKKFIFKSFVIFIIIIFSLILLYLIPGNSRNYFAASIDKHKLLKITPSPRIILIGGSNLAFGLDSEMLEKELNYQAINMSLHADLGLKLMINEVKPYIKEHDIVVIIPEYEHFFGDFFDGDGVELVGLLDVNPVLIKYLTINQLHKIICNIPLLFKCKINSLKYMVKLDHFSESIYYRSAFNKNGDAVSHLDKKADAFTKNPPLAKKINTRAIVFLNNFCSYANKYGATVYFCFPSFSISEYRENQSQISYLEKELKNNLKIQILNSPEDCLFSEDNLFDTSYHMNREGRKIRTRELIDSLKKHISSINRGKIYF